MATMPGSQMFVCFVGVTEVILKIHLFIHAQITVQNDEKTLLKQKGHRRMLAACPCGLLIRTVRPLKEPNYCQVLVL
jgi:hypothetical protein